MTISATVIVEEFVDNDPTEKCTKLIGAKEQNCKVNGAARDENVKWR